MAEDGFKGNVAIIGLGLLGTSLALALKDSEYKVSGWTRRKEVRNWALDQEVISETNDDLGIILKNADITVICLPIPKIMDFIRDNAKAWKPGAVVTDIGSVKEVIVNAGEAALAGSGVYFVGSHPMAGTEKSGPESAFKELYNNAEVFVTRTFKTSSEAFDKVKSMWEAAGTTVVEAGVKEHDNLVAHTSHISHVIALALTQAVLDCDDELRPLRYSGCATGFRDTSRITSSSPKMWREIIENNQSAVLETVRQVESKWSNLARIIEEGDFTALEAEFAKGKHLRDDWIKYKNETKNCNW